MKKEAVFCSYRVHKLQRPPRSTDNFDHILPSRFLCFKGKRCVLWCHRDIESCLRVSEKCRRWMKIWSVCCFYWKTNESERNEGPSSARLAGIYPSDVSLRERKNEIDTATAFPMDSCLCFIVVCCLLQMSSILINVLTEILMLTADTSLIFIQRQPKLMLIFHVLPKI